MRSKRNLFRLLVRCGAGVFIFGSHFLYGQQPEDTSPTVPYREDQFYFGASFISFSGGASAFKQNGFSPHFQIGFVRDIPLVPSGKLAMGVGVGYDSQRWVSNWLRVSKDNSVAYTFWESGSSFEKMEYSFQSLVIPICIRWRSSSVTNYKFWRVYSGVKWHWNYAVKAINASEKIRISQEVNRWTPEAYASFGYNTWNFYVGYDLKGMFSGLPNTEALGDLRTLKIGLIFYVL